MALNIFKNKTSEAKKQAKADYVKAAELKGDSREVRAFKMRIALRCRAHVDSAFIEGAKKTAQFQESAMLLASQGKEKQSSQNHHFSIAPTASTAKFYLLPQSLTKRFSI